MQKFLILLCTLTLLLFAGCATQPPPEEDAGDEEAITKMYITVNEHKLEVSLAENSSVDALVSRLREEDITFTASENGGFEIYGSIGKSLPTNNTQITAGVGDVLLYAGNNICIFYGSNSYSYTRIGKISGYTASELRDMLKTENGKVQVTISFTK